MEETPDQLFARYRRDGDPAWLAKVFDLTAPRLLRVAIHLAGEAGVAEDIVQATFVTAIERAQSFDTKQPLEPWLTGILANHARAMRRGVQRHATGAGDDIPDLERLLAREQATPLEQAERSELSGAIAEALDKLPEPYRQTLILRLRHGMRPADIAHVVGDSSGAVRVRIHRGIEMLRKLLPAGFVATGFLVVSPSRGLAAVREAVVAKAAAASVAAGTTGILGSALVAKKLVVGAVLALLVSVLTWKLWPDSRVADDPTRAFRSPPSAASSDGERTAGGLESSKPREFSAPLPRIPVATPTSAARVLVRGRVVDGDSGAPVEGALVTVYPPRTTRLSDLKRRWSDYLTQEANGGLRFRVSGDWPYIMDKLSPLALADGEEFTVCDPPLPGAASIAETTSGPDGSFEVLLEQPLGFLVCNHAGYGTRSMPLFRSEPTVKLWPPRSLFGYVVDQAGKRVERAFRLRFEGSCVLPKSSPDAGYDVEHTGKWVVETKPDGSFRTEIPASHVSVHSLELEWPLVHSGIHPVHQQPWVYQTDFDADAAAEPAILAVRRSPVLVVRDAATKQPIDSFSLLCETVPSTVTRWGGRFFAPAGRMRLLRDLHDDDSYSRDLVQQRLQFMVWADGHEATTIELERLSGQGEIVAELPAGELPLLAGTVVDSGTPVAGCRISVLHAGRYGWSPDQTWMSLDTTSTDEQGEFRMRLPSGSYVVCARRGEQTHSEKVDIPLAKPWLIDLGAYSSILVRLIDSRGGPCAGHLVFLVRGPNGRQQSAVTNAQGEAELADLPPAKYEVAASREPQSWFGGVPQDVKEIELAPGERRLLEITLPVSRPRHAKLVSDGNPSFEGWQARNARPGDRAWAPVAAAGEVPIDIESGVWGIQIEGPDGERWEARIPPDAPDGFPIRIPRSHSGYEGVLTDRASGRPLAGIRVVSRPWVWTEVHSVAATWTTDSAGRFRLAGLEAPKYALSFESSEDSRKEEGLEGIYFLPDSPPSDPPWSIDIAIASRQGPRVEGLPDCTISGHIRIAGQSRGEAKVEMLADLREPDGWLRIAPRFGGEELASDGSYEVHVPAAARYTMSVYDVRNKQSLPPIEWTPVGTGDREIRDFDLP